MATAKPIMTAVGRRKTAIATVRLFPADEGSVQVNGAAPADYFKTDELVRTASEALGASEAVGTYAIHAHVSGGGVAAQAGALRHAIARALSKLETPTRAPLKKAGFLSRDPRAKERKKPGLVKARKRKQWSKR